MPHSGVNRHMFSISCCGRCVATFWCQQAYGFHQLPWWSLCCHILVSTGIWFSSAAMVVVVLPHSGVNRHMFSISRCGHCVVTVWCQAHVFHQLLWSLCWQGMVSISMCFPSAAVVVVLPESGAKRAETARALQFAMVVRVLDYVQQLSQELGKVSGPWLTSQSAGHLSPTGRYIISWARNWARCPGHG